MKKIIIGALALLIIGIGGLAISNKVAGATDQGKPVITIEPVETSKDIYKESKFILEYNIKPQEIYMKDTGNIAEVIINNHLEIKSDEEFEVLSVEASGSKVEKVEKEGMKFILPKIQYNYQHSTQNLKADDMNIKIEFRAKNTMNKTYENFNERISYKYKNLKEKEVTKSPSKKQTLNVIELIYKGGKIDGVEEPSKNIDLGREFLIKHSITPGNVEPKRNEARMLTTFTEQAKRNLIYVVDKGAIDLEGGNDELARDSIIKGLESIKDSGVTASLIVYGEKAEIIKSGDKDSFSIAELISLVEKIESNDKSGNLGDALRKAEMLSSKTEGEDSIIVVSAGDPNYYTQVSEGNSAMLYTIVEKDGFSIEDRKLSEEYTNKVINEIVMNSEENTRWYGINYGLEKEEIVLNNAIKKLDGSTLEVKKPYYDDFASTNKKATNAITLRGKFIVNSKNQSIKIHEEDKNRELELEYDENLQPIPQNINTRISIVDLRGKDDEEKGFDVASSKNIEVKLIIEFNGEKKEIEFNTPNENEEDTINWWVKPDVPYVISTGLYNGRKNLVGKTRDIQETIDDVKWASSQLLDELSFAELAPDNYFTVGIIIKSSSEKTIIPFLRGENLKLGTIGFYEINNNTITKLDSSGGYNLKKDKMYLFTIDQYIKDSIDIVGKEFEIGIYIKDINSTEQKSPTDEQQNQLKNDVDFWGININVVEKPEHF